MRWPTHNLVRNEQNNGKKDKKKFDPTALPKLEDVVGCKWSVSVLMAVQDGVTRPGALERHITGISTKVLSERLRKLTHYGLLSKETHAEVPPRTEYTLTENGLSLVDIIGIIHKLDERMKQSE